MRYLNCLARGETYPLLKFQNYHVNILNWNSDYDLRHIEQQEKLQRHYEGHLFLKNDVRYLSHVFRTKRFCCLYWKLMIHCSIFFHY